MTFFPDMKTVLTIGSLQVTWYAVLILSGAFLAYFLSLRQFKKWGYKEEVFENFFLMMLPIAIIGARLYYVIFEWNNLYAADPIRIFYIWEGGLAIHGGVIAGTIFGWVKENQNDIMQGIEFLKSLKKGGGMPPSGAAPVSPPLPPL